MTRDRRTKQQIRDRMARTGESYMTARRALQLPVPDMRLAAWADGLDRYFRDVMRMSGIPAWSASAVRAALDEAEGSAPATFLSDSGRAETWSEFVLLFEPPVAPTSDLDRIHARVDELIADASEAYALTGPALHRNWAWLSFDTRVADVPEGQPRMSSVEAVAMFLATHGLPNDLPRRLPEQVVGEVGWGALHASWAHAMQHAGRLVEATSALLVAQSSDVLGHLVMALIPYRQLHLDSLYFERHLVVAALARPSDPPPRRVLPRNLLSAADLVPALGPIDSGMAHTYPGTDGLTYHSLTYTCEGGEDSPGSFVVSVVGGTASPASYAAYFARRNAEQPGAYRQVEGVGDNAFISSASDSLSVRCDDMSLVFSTVGGARLTEAELVGIARLALKRARAVGP